MSYSIKIILHPDANKEDLQAVQLKLTFNSIRVYGKTAYKVKDSQFANGEIVKHPNAKQINFNLRSKTAGIEARLIDALKFSDDLTKEQLKAIVDNRSFTPSKKIEDFVTEILRVNNFSEGRMKHYQSVKRKLLAFRPDCKLSDIDVSFLQNFEAFLRLPDKDGIRLDGNTIHANIKIVKSIINKASKVKLIDAKEYADYKNPKYVQKIPEHLTEDEINTFLEITEKITAPAIRLSGFYFLLSCYTAYRISDLYAFRQDQMIKDDMITIRAKKNKQIVSIPVHDKLKVILENIKNKALEVTEQTMRKHVKTIAGLCGITRKIKVHTGRHTFAMLLSKNGFTKEDAKELMGEASDIIDVYFRIYNPNLHGKILKVFNIQSPDKNNGA